MEQHSEHPLANALREGVNPLGEEMAVRNQPGLGLEAEHGGATWRLGAPEFALAEGSLGEDDLRWLWSLVDDGGIVVALGRAGQARALFVLHDAVREGAADFVREARELGLRRVAILSGDQPGAVAHLARKVGIEEWHGGLRPEDKLAWLRQAQAEGATVLMAGDGINDAPTLAAAQASVSFGAATRLAQLHSDFVLLGTDLRALSRAIPLARETRRNTRQNLGWAAGYNLLAVPFASLGFINPWLAAIGMSLSSLLVVGNALRLRRAGLPSGDQ